MESDNIELTPTQMRQQEVAQYQSNIDTYSAILATLDTALPEHLEPYRTRTDKHQAITEIADLDDVQTLSNVWFAQELHGRIRSEMLEQSKARAILAVLEAQSPA